MRYFSIEMGQDAGSRIATTMNRQLEHSTMCVNLINGSQEIHITSSLCDMYIK